MTIRERPFRRQVHNITPTPGPDTAAVRRQIQQDFGAVVPPFLLHLPAPEALRAYWAIYREPTAGRRVARTHKEAVAATVSAINTCPYCVDVHTMTLDALDDRATARAIASRRPDEIRDPDVHALVAWAQATCDPSASILRERPFLDEQAPELIGTAVSYHYINRMVNIFATASPFPGAGPMSPLARRAATVVFRRLLARDVVPGASLQHLEPAPLPEDLAWTSSDPIIADAFARAAATLDTLGRRVVPDGVRDVVASRINAWRGEQPGASRHWVEDLIDALPSSQQPMARLALLAALASYQVDDRILQDARPDPGTPGDAILVATAAWASFSAARRIGRWLDTAPTATADSRRRAN